MISSLPKPVQNDVDTVIIDLLSRYSLDNKNVRQFVQTVAQQVRSLNKSIPRILKASSNSKGADTNKNELNQTKDSNTAKPNFLTRLDNLQASFNKGGLLGVIFEHLKNKQVDANTINPVSVPEKTEQKDTNQEQKDNKQPEQQKGFLEKISSKFERLEKLQEVYDKRGLIGVTQNIFNQFKRKAENQTDDQNKLQEISTVNNTDIDNNQTKENQNNLQEVSTTFNAGAQAGNTTNITENTTEEKTGQNAQAENLLPDEVVVLIGGVNEYGRKDLTDIIKKSLGEAFDEQKKIKGGLFAGIKSQAAGEGGTGGGGGGEGGLIDLLADIAMIKGGFKGASKFLGKGGMLSRAAGGLARFGSGAAALGGMPVSTAVTGAGGAAGLAGAGAAVVGGELIGGQIGKGIGSNETFSEYMYGSKTAGKEAYEKYGTGMLGFTKASYDYLFGEGREARKQTAETEAKNVAMQKEIDTKTATIKKHYESKGYKTLEEFGKAVKAGETEPVKWNKETNKLDILPRLPSKLAAEDTKAVKTTVEPLPTTTTETNPSKTNTEVKTEPTQSVNTIETKQSTITPENIIQPTKTELALNPNKTETTTAIPKDTDQPSNIYVPKDLSKIEVNKWTESVKEHLKTQVEQTTQTSLLEAPNTNKQPQELKTTTPVLENTTQYPEVRPIMDKTLKPVQPLDYKTEPVKPFKFNIPESSSLLVSDKTAAKEKEITPLTPDITEIPAPVSPNITENHITNNNADKGILTDIAGNTEKTNKSITSLSEAVFALAKVFDGKSSGGNNNFLINNGQQTQQFTSTAQIAAANKDTIREIRRQFLHVIG